MKLLSLFMAISIGLVASAGSQAANHHRSRDKQQIALKIFSSSDNESKKEKKSKKEDSKKSESKKGDSKEPSETSAGKDADEQSESRPQTAEPKAETPKPAGTPVAVAKPIPVATAKSSDTAPTDVMPIDNAMMSVLRDIDKALRESEDVPKIEDPAQHAAVVAALHTLDVALDKAKMNPNRIVLNEHKDKFEKSLTAESWESGEVELPNSGRASLNVIWAKKVNGLINVTITGNCGCHPNYAGERVGEWVVVLNGKSTLDTGFDIQSQSNVNFWLGKLVNFSVDATTCGEQVSRIPTKTITLKALNTEQRRKFFAEAATTAKKSVKEDAQVSASSTSSKGVTPVPISALPPAISMTVPHSERKSEPSSILEQVHLPSATAHVLVPKRAVAGEYITVSVVDAHGKPEPFVELNFNDFKATTNAHGRVTFQVPEDSHPGPSLSVSLASNTDSSPEQVYILQPLIRPSTTDIPRIDKWNINRVENTITIEGHNFDGIAENNRVILDARKEATIRFSSPVEIQAHVADLQAGGHDVIVQRNGLRSEPISLGVPTDQTGPLVTKSKKKS